MVQGEAIDFIRCIPSTAHQMINQLARWAPKIALNHGKNTVKIPSHEKLLENGFPILLPTILPNRLPSGN
jgi:hypothetical protein